MRRHEHCNAAVFDLIMKLFSLPFVFRDDMGLGKTVQCISLIW